MLVLLLWKGGNKLANQTTIGELSINLKMRLEGLEKGLETAQKKLQSIEKQNEQLKNSNNQLDASFIAMSVTAVTTIKQITNAVQEGVNKYNSYVNNMTALEKTARATNNSMTEVKETIEDVNKLKLMDDADVTASTKNLLTYGFTVKQTGEILNVLQDAAVGNRQANYTLSEAVRVTTEGIRMENSVLSDAAGVQKNISKMYEEYAQKIGKTTDSLTQAEKAQAVYNGIMAEASMFTGSAAEMASGYQGQQAQLNAVNLELSRTIGESMIPTLTQYSSLQLSITQGLTEFIKNHKGATSGVITFTTTLLGTIVVLATAKKAYNAYSAAAEKANMTTKAFTASLLINPITAIATAIAAVIASLTILNTKLQETIDKANEMVETSQRVGELIQKFYNNDMTYTEAESNEASEIVQNTKKENEELKKELDKRKQMIMEMEEAIDFHKKFDPENIGVVDRLNEQLVDQKEIVSDLENQIELYDKRVENLNRTLDYNKVKQEYLTLTNTKASREALVNIAQTQADIEGKKKLLNILKQGKTGTEQYKDAKNQLVKAYPELAKVNENTIASTEKTIAVEEEAAKKEWDLAQNTIKESIAELQAMQANDEKVQQIAAATQQKVEAVRASIVAATTALMALSNTAMADLQSNVTTTYTPKAPTGGSYQNKVLDNYKKQIEHKKAMDQISLKQEISMYQTALRKYAKTADEKNEIREKIYELNKELANKEKEILDQQTEDYEAYMQKQKNLKGAAYDVKEQTKDYDKIITMHNKYLKQIMKDERLSLDERKALYREELAVVRDYEQQKRDLRVEAVDNTITQLTNAITKQLEEMQSKDKEFIDKQIEEIEKLKEIRINAINEEYDAKIEAIEKELAALDKAEQQKSRDEEDAEYEKKRKRLEDLIAFEHDAVSKANYQKELDKLLTEHQKTLDARALEDKKEALNEQKDLLQEEQDNKIQAIEDEAEKQKEVYNKQLEELEEYYSKQTEMAQETAEKMLLNVQQNQDNILNLLKKYGDKYEITGQTLGEKLAQGINNGIADKIQNIIQKIQDTIDSNLEAKIKEWTASSYKYEASANKPQTKTVNVTQNNYIEQNPEMPSETYRKLNNVSENLAAQLRAEGI